MINKLRRTLAFFLISWVLFTAASCGNEKDPLDYHKVIEKDGKTYVEKKGRLYKGRQDGENVYLVLTHDYPSGEDMLCYMLDMEEEVKQELDKAKTGSLIRFRCLDYMEPTNPARIFVLSAEKLSGYEPEVDTDTLEWIKGLHGMEGLLDLPEGY